MPGNPPPVADERSGLLTFLAQQRYLLKLTAHGLTDQQARSAPSASSLSVGGLIKHVALTERNWVHTMFQEPPEEVDWFEAFQLGADETLAGALARYDEVARLTEDALAGVADLGQPVPVPQGVPWYPADVDNWSVRWVLLHLIEETARHVGHADIVRESLDGATAIPLMAAAEGWPATAWVQPWSAGPG